MNEIIRKFERESGLEIYGLGARRDKWEDALEKYAELVLKDVIDIMNDTTNYNAWVYTTHDLATASGIVTDLKKKIKDHFGV